MLKQLALATFAVTALLAVQSPANAGPRPGGECDEFGCGLNGPQLNGIAAQTSEGNERFQARCEEWGCGTNGKRLNGTALNGVKVAPQLSVNSVILPTGEIVDLR